MPQNLEQPDPAATFACAHSLWEYGEKNMNVSEVFDGAVGFMSVIMRAGALFENWSCKHIAFDELEDCWPYLLQDSFGVACFEILESEGLERFNEKDCLRVALRLKLPIRLDRHLLVPVSFTTHNPHGISGFRKFRIQSVRDLREDNETVPFVTGDDPFDDEYGTPYFSFYGVRVDATLEHIADRKTYLDAITLAQRLIPGISFPVVLQPQNALK